MATKQVIKEFESTYEHWKSLDFSDVYRKELNVESNHEIKVVIDDLNKKYARLFAVKELMPSVKLETVTRRIKSRIDAVTRLSDMDSAGFIQNKDAYNALFISDHEAMLEIWSSVVALYNDQIKEPETSKIASSIKRWADRTQNDAKAIAELKENLEKELEDIRLRYNPATNQAELDVQKNNFEKQAKKHDVHSKTWLVGISLSIILFIVVLFWVFENFCFDIECYQKIEEINYSQIDSSANRSILYLEISKAVIFRLLLISSGLYLLNFCVKNYDASMHNFTVNSQKANSLEAAIRLIERAKTDQGNDSIVTQAASAIFSHQPTGYNKKNPENVGTSLSEKIIEKINPIN